MPRQNRVTPFGDFEAVSSKGSMMGNRGILHDENGVLGAARWRHPNWVACTLSFKGRRRTIMLPGHYTELFFCDEAVALAAGHRPCAECRRDDFRRFMSSWRKAHGLSPSDPLKASEVDRKLHAARVRRDKTQITFQSILGAVPDGAFVELPNEPGKAWLVRKDQVRLWSHEGYGEARQFDPSINVTVLTPEPTVQVLAAGYTPALHPTAMGE